MPQFRNADNVGRLLLIRRCKPVTVDTKFGQTDAVSADVVVVLDGPGAPTEYHDVLLFGVMLYRQLAGHDFALGRLDYGEAKEGKNPPWILTAPSEDDMRLAAGYQ